MNCLIPALKQEEWKQYVEKLTSQRPLPLFSSLVIKFLQEISSKILKDNTMRKYPELIATAYWLRKSNLVRIQKEFEMRHEGKILLPRGIVLHFAPSNVDSIFLYSWVLSMLVGNINIIRLSQQQNEQIRILLEIIRSILKQKQYEPIKERTFVISYAHDTEITRYLSSMCHLRVIWGGDETISTIRSIPLPPIATEIVFPDRFSSVVLSADMVNRLDEKAFSQLIHHFYNDAFWFQQRACSSPRLVCWIGENGQVEAAKQRFWEKVRQKIEQEQYELPTALHMMRLTTAFYYGAQTYAKEVSSACLDIPLRVEVNKVDQLAREMHCGGGLFLEMTFPSLLDIADIIIDKDQTLSYFGFSKEELTAFIYSLKGRGIDRIVPIGKALDFLEVWDGYNLLTYLTREIDLQ